MREIMPKELRRQTMNTLGFWIVTWLALLCGPMVSRGSAEMIKFDVAGGFGDFEFAKTRDGRIGEWAIVPRKARSGPGRAPTANPDHRVPLATSRRVSTATDD